MRVFESGISSVLEAVTRDVGHPPERAQQHVELDLGRVLADLRDQQLAAVPDLEALRLVTDANVDALRTERIHHDLRDLRVLAQHQPGRHLHLGDLRAQAREGLREFAADRSAAQHQQAPRKLPELPDRVRGQATDLVDPGYRRHQRAGTGGDHDVAGCDRALLRCLRPAFLRSGQLDLDLPGGADGRLAPQTLDAQRRVAFHRIVGLDLRDHALDALHHVGEVELGIHRADAVGLALARLVQQLGGADQCLRRNAAGVQAVAPHPVALDERDLRLDRRGDVRADQPRAAAADHHHVAIEACGSLPARVDLACVDHRDELLRSQRHHAEQRERHQDGRRQDALQRFEPGELRAHVHVDDRAEQHADLAHPVEGAHRDRREAHHQVDQEEREDRHQSQREQVERSLPANAVVDRCQLLAEASLDRVVEEEARGQEGQCRAHAGRERHDERSPEQPEDRAAQQRHQRRPGQRQRGHQQIDRKVHGHHRERALGEQRGELDLPRLDFGEREVAIEPEREEGQHRAGEHEQEQQPVAIHPLPPAGGAPPASGRSGPVAAATGTFASGSASARVSVSVSRSAVAIVDQAASACASQENRPRAACSTESVVEPTMRR